MTGPESWPPPAAQRPAHPVWQQPPPGATGVGIALLLVQLFVIIPLSLLFVGVLLWFLVAPFVMYSAAQSAHAFNRRNGIVVR